MINKKNLMDYKDKIQSRQEYNRQILKKLAALIEAYPQQRFGQIVANYVLPDYREHDIFFEESYDTLKNLNNGLG